MQNGTFPGQFAARMDTPLGAMTAASDGASLTGLWFDGQAHCPDPSGALVREDLPVFRSAARWLAGYFAGSPAAPGFPLRPAGTPFQQEVWAILRTIPYGETVTYGAIAAQIAANRGIPRFSAHAVGGGVARNPISILIPCHRVIGANGALTGYAGGIARKAQLLALERGDVNLC